MPEDILSKIKREPALLLYFKNDTCQPCKVLRVKVEELVNEKYPNIQFQVLNIEEHAGLVSALNILSSPTILLFLDGKEYLRGGIYTSIQELDSKISRFYRMMF